ncbi:class I SAM-dependent methyltransferase [Candidatus Woesearchaeota archaeon]|nr:class I SAM-dependent methyltransferase [Candidatus Woesearchaeota archaeon]
MIDKNILEAHYAEYASQPQEWVANMEQTKRSIVAHVLDEATGYTQRWLPSSQRRNVLVLGASDKRYLSIHHRIFNAELGNASVTTYDIDAEHLGRGPTVIEHDVTRPFPRKEYDLVFSHELMKFLTPEEQVLAIGNAHDTLVRGGLAMHIIHEPSIKGTAELREWQYRVDPSELERRLLWDGIPAIRLEFESESSVDWLRHTVALVTPR